MAGYFKSRLFFISVALVVIAATLPLYVSGYILGLLTVAYYFGVFAMSWDLLFGFGRRSEFRSDLPDRRRRLYCGHPQ